MGLDWEDAGEEVFEPVFRRDAALAKTQGVFHSFPDLVEWRTGDLFAKHPTEPDVWRYEGRRDDVVILNHGENIAPAQLERQLRSVAGVEEALLVGNQRPALAVLLQLGGECNADPTRRLETLERVLEAVLVLNEGVGPLAQILRHRVLVAEGARPFVRTRKGPVSRRRTVSLYEKEIDALYVEAPAATS
jgi:acyl-coenzyme A synthetase/AMP-(fatty) acid ligase